jgi:NADPH:quinone reductase-like Zn-dependent oxidoreductase
MKAVLMKQPGSLDALYIGELREPTPGPGDLLINVRAAGVNPADWKIIERGFAGWTFPKAIGLDAAGVVAAVGEHVTNFAAGDRVYYHGSFAGLGAYAERVVTRSHVVAKLPDSVPFEVAAAIPTAGFTAYQVIEDRFHVGPHDVVLIHAGAGGVGGIAIQLAKRRGATVITTCSADNATYVRRLGADHHVNYAREDLAKCVSQLTHGRGVDAILDTVGPSVGANAIAMLAFQGYLACCVGLPDLTALQPLPRGVQIADIALGWAYLSGDARAQARLAYYGQEMAKLVAAGVVNPMIAEVVEFDQSIEALKRSKSGRQRGKLVIRVASS